MNSLTSKVIKNRIPHLATVILTASLYITATVDGRNSHPFRGPMVIKVIRLDHADAKELASILRPLLTEEGRMTAYPPTNTLIIRDRQSLVEQLVRIIKGAETPW